VYEHPLKNDFSGGTSIRKWQKVGGWMYGAPAADSNSETKTVTTSGSFYVDGALGLSVPPPSSSIDDALFGLDAPNNYVSRISDVIIPAEVTQRTRESPIPVSYDLWDISSENNLPIPDLSTLDMPTQNVAISSRIGQTARIWMIFWGLFGMNSISEVLEA
jgi:hypothetical protein